MVLHYELNQVRERDLDQESMEDKESHSHQVQGIQTGPLLPTHQHQFSSYLSDSRLYCAMV